MGDVKRYEPQVVDESTVYGRGISAQMAEISGTSSAPGWYAQADYARLERERDELKQQAECHAMEARTANATIAEIYQAVTGATGEPGNWNGALPVVAELTRLRAMEAAAIAYVDADNANRERFLEFCALAEACGRKG